MNHLTLVVLSAVLFTALDPSSSQGQAKTDATKPSNQERQSVPPPRRPQIDDAYRAGAKEFGQRALYPNESEEEVYEDVKIRNMHFRYVAFIEMFPSSAHLKEIEGLTKNFYVFTTPKRILVPFTVLSDKYRWKDGILSVDWWADPKPGVAVNIYQILSEASFGKVWTGKICFGNLQFLSGGFILRERGIELLAGTSFIYPEKFPQIQPQEETVVSEVQTQEPLAPSQSSHAGAQDQQAPEAVTISPEEAAGLLLGKTAPVYPPIAKAARVSGTVVVQVAISETGAVENLRIDSGPAMLQQAALDAVMTYTYRPYLLNNKPAKVLTKVYVTFTLGE